MQQKEFEMVIRASIPAAGVSSSIIENTGLSKLNFHGIRFTGRVQSDMAEAADKYGSGLISLMCIPNDQIAIPNLQTETDLNDSNSFIIAVIPYQLAVRDTLDNESLGYSGTFDFEITPKTSRSCMKGGKIVGQVSNTSGSGLHVLTAILSSFETF